MSNGIVILIRSIFLFSIVWALAFVDVLRCQQRHMKELKRQGALLEAIAAWIEADAEVKLKETSAFEREITAPRERAFLALKSTISREGRDLTK